MKSKILFTIALILIGQALFSQRIIQIKGVVIDANTHEPLVGATVIDKNYTNKGVVTDLKGEFTLSNISNEDEITVSFIGYEDVSISPNSEYIRIELKPSSMNLDEVVVIGKNDLRKVKESAMAVSVISMEQLKGTVSDITDVLDRTAGITIRSTGGVGSASRVSVRGLEGKRVGFFIDDYPMSDNTDFVGINDIPVELIERIEIYKGVVPAKFGGSAVGGAVNIVIKEFPSKYIDANYTIGSYNSHKASIIAKRNIKKAGIEFGAGATYESSNNDYTMESPFEDGLIIKRDHDKYSKTMAAMTFEATKWWFDKVTLEPVFINTKQQVQGIEFNIQEAHNYSNAYLLPLGFEKDNMFIDGLDLDWSMVGAYTDYYFEDMADHRTHWDGSTYAPVSEYGGETNHWASDFNNKKKTFSSKLYLEYLANENHSFGFNSVFTFANGNPTDSMKYKTLGYETNFKSTMTSLISGFNYDYKDRDDKFLNSLNVKYYLYDINTSLASIVDPIKKDIDMNKMDYGVVNAMRYRFTPSLMAKFSAGYDVRLPSESELLGDGYIIAPAGSLLPERNTSVNIGILYDLMGKRKSNLQIELSGYFMYLEDMIRLTGGALQSQYQNFGEMKTMGVELDIKCDITKNLYGYANGTYQDLRDARKLEYGSTNANPTYGMKMPNIPSLMANAGLEFHKANLFGGRGMNTRITIDGSFIEEYYYDFELSSLQERRIPRSLSFDMGVEQSFCNGRFYVIATLFNVTNENIISEFNRPLPGRNFNIRLRYVLI